MVIRVVKILNPFVLLLDCDLPDISCATFVTELKERGLPTRILPAAPAARPVRLPTNQ